MRLGPVGRLPSQQPPCHLRGTRFQPAEYGDLFLAYCTRLFGDKAGAIFQLNVPNIQESGRLQLISAYPDGTPNGHRIVDPRQFILTATFEL